MKKWEKVCMIIFGSFIGLFIMELVYRCGVLKESLDYNFFDPFTLVIVWGFAISVVGSLVILVSTRLRKRVEKEQKPISPAYRASFILSFIPFMFLMINCTASIFTGFSFMGSTWYGSEAFWDTFVFIGILLFSCIIPVFPFCIFWQILYIIKSIKYRKYMKAVNNQ
ncbi:MAG: hypothetical protein IKW96_14520 [Ruminococcus sp.]|uniref:hypothetical protein n=1 Tax=Ruminococcus sp. TaxID=41978 RepID=UPI0025F18D77|nr:hypothetical protein [Ruminococcus sp.]MBR5684465.1 hypothetical protein [Ruminococcus sp.]